MSASQRPETITKLRPTSRTRPQHIRRTKPASPSPKPSDRLLAARREGWHVEIEAVRAHLGALWPVVFNVLIKGASPEVWAMAIGMNVHEVCRYLAVAQDRLAVFYAGETKRGMVQDILCLS